MGRPPSNGAPSFRFNPVEVAQMEAILQKHEGHVPPRDLLVALADRFSNTPDRAGKFQVQMKQVWNWFQNRRYALRAKLVKSPGKPSTPPVPRDEVTPVRSVPPVPQQMAVSSGEPTAAHMANFKVEIRSGPHMVRNTSEPPQMEFEAKSARDGAWYDVQAFLSHRYLESGNPEVLVRFSGFGPEEDEWVNIRKHCRQRSLPCEASECIAVLPGDLILCFQEGKEQALYFDAHVFDAQRRRHDVRGCRCRFLVRYDHDQSEEIVQLRKICRRPETDYRLQQLHAANEAASTAVPMELAKPVVDLIPGSTLRTSNPIPSAAAIAVPPPTVMNGVGPSIRPPVAPQSVIPALVRAPIPSLVAPSAASPSPSGPPAASPFTTGPPAASPFTTGTPAASPSPIGPPAATASPSPIPAPAQFPASVITSTIPPTSVFVATATVPTSQAVLPVSAPFSAPLTVPLSAQIPAPVTVTVPEVPAPVIEPKMVESDVPAQLVVPEPQKVESHNPAPTVVAVPELVGIDNDNPAPDLEPVPEQIKVVAANLAAVPPGFETTKVGTECPSQVPVLVTDPTNMEIDSTAPVSVPEPNKAEIDNPPPVPEPNNIQIDNPAPEAAKVEVVNLGMSDGEAGGQAIVTNPVATDKVQESKMAENSVPAPVLTGNSFSEGQLTVTAAAQEKVESSPPRDTELEGSGSAGAHHSTETASTAEGSTGPTL